MDRQALQPNLSTSSELSTWDWLEILPFAAIILDAQQKIIAQNALSEPLLDNGDLPQSLVSLLDDMVIQNGRLKAYDHLIIPDQRAHIYLNSLSQDYRLLLIDPLESATYVDQQLYQQEVGRRAGLMAAMLAHEVKNPLAGIRGAAQLLELADADDLPALVNMITNEVDRVTETLNRVEFLTHDAASLDDSVNVHEVLRYVCFILAPVFEKEIEVIEQFDPSLPEVMGDREQLIQLCFNLIKNAAEAMESTPNPQLILRTSWQQGFQLRMKGQSLLPLTLQIEDNGPGIPSDVQPMLFDPFVSTKKEGKGLGLAICAKIVAHHHGSLELLESTPGKTVFSVRLPAFI